MQQSLNPRNPTIYRPKSLTELINIMDKEPTAVIWAGGMHIMSRDGFYPNPASPDIVSLEEIADLKRISGTEYQVEAGSMVTIDQLLSSGLVPSDNPLYKALNGIGTFIVKEQATLGGAVAIRKERFALCAILASIDAEIELKILQRGNSNRKKNARYTSHWINIDKLYREDGTFVYADNALVTKIRITPNAVKSLITATVGSAALKPEETVFFSLNYILDQEKISLPKLCLTFPTGGFYCSIEINGLLGTLNLPLSQSTMKDVVTRFGKDLKRTCPDITEIQYERSKRLLLSNLYKINAEFLSRRTRRLSQLSDENL